MLIFILILIGFAILKVADAVKAPHEEKVLRQMLAEKEAERQYERRR